MAKVTMPLYSATASGKIAGAMVFFPWKGKACVRQLVTPVNRMTADQGDARLHLGGAGRAAAAANKNGDFVGQLESLSLIPGGQTKQSFIARKLVQLYMHDKTAFDAEYTEYAAHAHKSAFDVGATSLALVTFDIAYKGGSHAFVGGLMVYLLAKLAISLGFSGAPYTTALASWNTSEVTAFVADLNAA